MEDCRRNVKEMMLEKRRKRKEKGVLQKKGKRKRLLEKGRVRKGRWVEER
jgi:hypothetical protein